MIEIREPQAAIWGFYPISRTSLIKEIEKMFKDSIRGPGSLPIVGSKKGQKHIIGGVVPHAGYGYSGFCAAWLYKELGEHIDNIDVVVIMGTNHTGFGGKITTTTYYRRWSTPLGDIDVDIDFINKLKNYYPHLSDDALAHTREHSIEVQLPFLQYLYGNKFSLVPIVVKDVTEEEATAFSKALNKAINEDGRRFIVLASSDFTHHGDIYGYTIFYENIAANVKKLDLMFIEAIINLDTKKFLSLINKYNATVCGYGAIAILMEYSKMNNAHASLLKYYHSADITGDEDIVVGYASIIFHK